MRSKDDQESLESAAVWWNLYGRAWTEDDPVKFLEVTMQITKFLAKKQERLDAEYDQIQTDPPGSATSPRNWLIKEEEFVNPLCEHPGGLPKAR